MTDDDVEDDDVEEDADEVDNADDLKWRSTRCREGHDVEDYE